MKKLVYLLIGALLCFSMLGCSNEKAANALKDAIYLDQPVINPANEGKLVIIHGVAKMSKGAQDSDLGITFDSPVVIREVQVLTAQTRTTSTTTTTKTDDKKNTTSQTTETKKTTEYVWKDNNSKSDRAPWRKETFTGEAKIGQFTITGNPLNSMFRTKKIEVTRDMASRSGMNYWKQSVTTKAFLTNRRIAERFMQVGSELRAQNEGVSRISFTGREKESNGEYTIAGIQQNGKLVSTKDFTIQCYSGILTKDQMIEKNK